MLVIGVRLPWLPQLPPIQRLSCARARVGFLSGGNRGNRGNRACHSVHRSIRSVRLKKSNFWSVRQSIATLRIAAGAAVRQSP